MCYKVCWGFLCLLSLNIYYIINIVRIFKNTWFTKFAEKENISDDILKEITEQLEAGMADANLGGNVYKVRLARDKKGKSGGYRVIVFFKDCDKTFFIYCYLKSKKANINDKELKVYKEAAKVYFSMTTEHLEEKLKYGQLIEL